MSSVGEKRKQHSVKAGHHTRRLCRILPKSVHLLQLVEMEKQCGLPDISLHKQPKAYVSQCQLCETVETDVGQLAVCTQDVECGGSKWSPETLHRSLPRVRLDGHRKMEPKIVENHRLDVCSEQSANRLST